MKTLTITYKKIPLIVQYETTETGDRMNPFDVELGTIYVRGTTADLYDIMRDVDIDEITDRVVSAELEEGYRMHDLMRDDDANEKD